MIESDETSGRSPTGCSNQSLGPEFGDRGRAIRLLYDCGPQNSSRGFPPELEAALLSYPAFEGYFLIPFTGFGSARTTARAKSIKTLCFRPPPARGSGRQLPCQ
jgi:hypothetical protein